MGGSGTSKCSRNLAGKAELEAQGGFFGARMGWSYRDRRCVGEIKPAK